MRTVDWRMLWEEHAEPGELRRVLCALAVSMGGTGGQAPTNCSPSMERIARRAGMRRDSASRWIKRAETEGWVNVGRVTGLRNRYYATVPKPLAVLLPEGASAQTKRPTRAPKTGRTPEQECHNCGSTSFRPKMYQGTDTGLLECTRCGAANAKPEPSQGKPCPICSKPMRKGLVSEVTDNPAYTEPAGDRPHWLCDTDIHWEAA